MPVDDRFPRLLEQAKLGQEAAFDQLYGQFNPALLRYFKARVVDDAEDLTAEVWLSAAQDLGRFEGDENAFRAWLFTIAHGRLDAHRTAARGGSEPVDPASLEALVARPGPQSLDMDSETAQAVVDRICTVLSPDQGDVILLRLIAGLSVAETAEVVGKTEGAVRVLQHRALQRLSREFSVEGIRL
jgi:RNA polymerase sigma-70 factor (ECF subfamily)